MDTDSVSVLIGRGDGSFSPAARFTAGGNPFFVVLGDLDGDSLPDLVTANSESRDVGVLIHQSEPAAPVPGLPAGGLLGLMALRAGAALWCRDRSPLRPGPGRP